MRQRPGPGMLGPWSLAKVIPKSRGHDFPLAAISANGCQEKPKPGHSRMAHPGPRAARATRKPRLSNDKEQAGNHFPDFPRLEDLWDSRPRLFFIRTAEGGCPTTVGQPPSAVFHPDRQGRLSHNSRTAALGCFSIRTAKGGCPTTVGLESGSDSQPVPNSTAEGVDARRAGTPAPLADSAGCQWGGRPCPPGGTPGIRRRNRRRGRWFRGGHQNIFRCRTNRLSVSSCRPRSPHHPLSCPGTTKRSCRPKP